MARVMVLIMAGVLGWTACGTYIPIYQWIYDRLPLGPGFHGHVFANDLSEDAMGLMLELSGPPRQVACLVFGGDLVPNTSSEQVHLVGRVVSGGVAVVALPEEVRLLRAAWITATRQVSIDVESPIPRIRATDLGSVFVEVVSEKEPCITTLPYPTPECPQRVYREIIQELEFAEWLLYPYVVRLSAHGSFSPLGEEIVSWTWVWEDGVVQAGPEVVRGFHSPDWHRVTLVVEDASGRKQTLRWLVLALPIGGELLGTEPLPTKPVEELPIIGREDLQQLEEKWRPPMGAAEPQEKQVR